MNLVFITGNQHKADYLTENLGMPIRHQKIDLDEVQSLDLSTVVRHKAEGAFRITGEPVLVEDISLTLEGMNGLPGPLVKWFLAAMDSSGLADLAQKLHSQQATVTIMYGLYDGTELHTFTGSTDGHIVDRPRGTNGFGFQDIFVPTGTTKTFAEMSDEEMLPYYHRLKALKKLRAYLERLSS